MATAAELTRRIAQHGADRRSGNAKPFNERVSALRNSLGLSQSQFAMRFKLPERTLQNWEQGRLKEPGAAARLLIALIETDAVQAESLIKRTDIENGLELVSL